MRVVYHHACPPEVRAALAPLLAKWAWLLPGWVYEINVGFDSATRKNTGESITEQDYRRIVVNVCSAWLQDSPAEREDTIRHELLHAVLQPTDDVLTLAMRHVKKSGDRAALRERARSANEGTVCDLMAIIARAFDVDARGAPRYR